MQAGRSTARSQRGYLMLAWLAAAALASAAASMLVTRWADELRREREQELLAVGDEIAGAIRAYALASAGSEMKHPPELSDLLEDRRAFGTLRHLRRIMPDPVTRSTRWGLVRAADGGIAGVFSRSDEPPMRKTPVRLANVDLPVASRLSDWRFVPRESGR